MKISIQTKLNICNEIRIDNGLQPLVYTYFYRHYVIKNEGMQKMGNVIVKRGGYREGSRNGKFKLTLRQIENMKYQIFTLGFNPREISKDFGVSSAYIYSHI